MHRNLSGLLLQEVRPAGPAVRVRSRCWQDSTCLLHVVLEPDTSATLKTRLFHPQARIKDPGRQAERGHHLNVAMLGTGVLMPNSEFPTSMVAGSLATLTFL